MFDFANGVHSLVGIDTPEAEKFVGIGAAEFKDAVVVGGETVGGFAVAAGNDAQLNATAIQVGHDFGQSLGDAFVEADGFTGGFEHRAVLDAVNDFRRVRAEAEVDYFHQLTLLGLVHKKVCEH